MNSSKSTQNSLPDSSAGQVGNAMVTPRGQVVIQPSVSMEPAATPVIENPLTKVSLDSPAVDSATVHDPDSLNTSVGEGEVLWRDVAAAAATPDSHVEATAQKSGAKKGLIIGLLTLLVLAVGAYYYLFLM